MDGHPRREAAAPPLLIDIVINKLNKIYKRDVKKRNLYQQRRWQNSDKSPIAAY